MKHTRERGRANGIPTEAVGATFPLSSAQYEVWLAQQVAPDVPLCIAHYVALRGPLDVDVLREATVAAAQEFGSPFLRLIEVDGGPRQVVDANTDRSIPLRDFRDESDPVAAATAWIDRDHTRPIPLMGGRLVESTVLRTADREHWWYSKIHHVALDGHGAVTMVNRIAELYTSATEHREPTTVERAHPQQLYALDAEYRVSERFAADRTYWSDRMKGVTEPTSLSDGSAPASARSVRIGGALLPDAADRLDHAGNVATATIVAAFACYLSRRTGRTDVLLTVPMSGRTTALLRRSGGMTAGAIPFPVHVDEHSTVTDLVQRVQLDLLGALRHQRFGLGDIRREVGADLSGPMVNVMLFPQRIAMGPVEGEYHIVSSGPVDDVLVNVYPRGSPSRTIVDFLANPGRYSPGELSARHREFPEFLDEFLTAEPNAPLESLHRETAEGGARRRAEAVDVEYWRRCLAGAPTSSGPTVDRRRPASLSQRVETAEGRVPSALARLLGDAHTSGSPLDVLRTALAVLLARLGDTDDVVIGIENDAPEPRLRTIPLRVTVNPLSTFAEITARIRDGREAAIEHAGVPLETLVRRLRLPRTPGRAPLFQVLVGNRRRQLDGLDMTVAITRSEQDDMQLILRYSPDLFDSATARLMVDRLLTTLKAMVDQPDSTIGDLLLLDRSEAALLTEFGHRPGNPAPTTFSSPDSTLAELFAAQVARSPDAPAVVFDEERLTYAQLADRAKALAAVLERLGVGPESVVMVAVPRSADLAVAILAVLETGGVYLPVDPDHPSGRLRQLLRDSGPVCVLTRGDVASRLPDAECPVLAVESCRESEEPRRPGRRRVRGHPDSAAYIIYTSGSTGKPKGVTVTHRNVVELLTNALHDCDFRTTDVWSCTHSAAFDFSVWELWGALLHGASVVIVDVDTVRTPDRLLELLRRERVTVLSQTPSAIEVLAAAQGDVPDLRYVVLGGERLDLEHLRNWYDAHDDNHPLLVNMYGITETTVHVTEMPLGRELMASAPASVIGQGLPGLRLTVLDRRLRPVPVGVEGELYVAGSQVARGYRGRYGLTATRFVADPRGPAGARMYRTGDVVRWRSDGHLEYLRRTDRQVQIRGHRVEPDEVEAVVRGCEGVGRCVVDVRTHPNLGSMLVGYVVPTPGSSVDLQAITEAVASRLPSYMTPDRLVALDKIPVTPNGKLDRNALPPPSFRTEQDTVPQTSVETVVAESFADCLGIPDIGLDDNFLELGGNSLAAARVLTRVNGALGSGLTVRDVLDAPTPRMLADRAVQAGGRSRPPLVHHTTPDRIPLSATQTRLWLVNRYDPESPAYNMPAAFRLRGTLDHDALRRAFADVLDRHAALRTVYPTRTSDGDPEQQILAIADAIPDLTCRPMEGSAFEEDIDAEISTGFDVRVDAPLRARLIQTGTDEHVLVVVVHHISADGASMVVLSRDLAAAYAAHSSGIEPGWPPLTVTYADYALWQRQLLEGDRDSNDGTAADLRYWSERLAGAAPVLDLPVDRPRPTRRDLLGARYEFALGADASRALDRLAKEESATLFMTAHAALALLLVRMSGTDEVVIGTPVDGRTHAALDDVVGLFVNTIALHTRIRGDMSFRTLLAKIRRDDLDAMSHSEIPFDRVVDALDPARSSAYTPVYQVLLEMRAGAATPRLPGLDVEQIDLGDRIAKTDLQLYVTDTPDSGVTDGGLTFGFVYATDIFDASTIEDLASRFLRLLENATTRPDEVFAAQNLLSGVELGLVPCVGGSGVGGAVLGELLVSGVGDGLGVAV
ncbi:MAG: amino acid adenylation domain-containing protein, partial [Rhodococcus sp.]|nr:amino acid adenylation domain-containing protein [Rhodococcus sp. (in: high G+C Gram-positive bacteria)]